MTSLGATDVPSFADVEDAARQLSGWARETPILENPILNDELGFRLLVKPECLQWIGAFKFRGAFNRISRIPEADRAKGVVAFSSGNHAQGVARASSLLGIDATIIMPSDAPKMKIDNTRALGANVLLYDRAKESREEIGEKLRQETGATLVKPYDDPYVIAGQGTLGIEIARQTQEMDAVPDVVLAPAGGGGLVAGVALAIDGTIGCPVYCCEPEGFDDYRRSLESGQREKISEGVTSICDSIVTPMPGEITFAINSRLLAGGLVASDEEVLSAMRTALLSFKIVVEPGGAIALASALTGKLAGHMDVAGKTVCVVCSGGNADPEMLTRALAMPA